MMKRTAKNICQSSADLRVCCSAGFQTCCASDGVRGADLEIGDAAGWETCATWLIRLLVAFISVSAISSARAQEAPKTDLQSFRIIPDRNIFDPNRSPRRDRSTRRERPRESGARVQSFQLVGTMSYEKGRFAFFDGTSSEYRKAIQASESIAGYKVVEIAPDHVALETTNGPMQLRVGMGMRRQDDEGWQVAEAGAYTEASAATTSTTSGSAPAGSASDQKAETSSGAESDILKRLLEKREQELKNEGK